MVPNYSGERTTDAQKRQREREIAQNIRSLHLTSKLVQRLHVSHAEAVAVTLARTLPEQFSFTQLEQAVAELVGDSTFLRDMRPDSDEDIAEKAAAKKANPSKNDLARLSPEARLAFANAKTAKQFEEAERAARQSEVADHDFKANTTLSPAARLSLANSWRKVGGESEPQPVSPEQLKKMDANRRLSAANEQAAAAAAKKAKA